MKAGDVHDADHVVRIVGRDLKSHAALPRTKLPLDLVNDRRVRADLPHMGEVLYKDVAGDFFGLGARRQKC